MGADINIFVESPEFDVNSLIKYIKKYADDIAYDINHILAKKQVEEARRICETAISHFYGDYTPRLYKRTGSLFYAYDVGIRGGDTFVFDIGSELMNLYGNHHQSNDIVFDATFMHGYHGGHQRSDGKYYWRFPSPKNAQLLGITPYITWYPFGPAPKSTPPYEEILNRWRIFLSKKYTAIKEEAIKNVINNYF